MTSRERWLTVLGGGRVEPPLRWEIHGYEPGCLAAWAGQGLPLDQRPEVFFGLDLLDLANVYWGPLPTFQTVGLFDPECAGRWHEPVQWPFRPLRREFGSLLPAGPPARDSLSLYLAQRCYNAHSPARYPLPGSTPVPTERPVALGWPGLSAWLAEACQPEFLGGELLADEGLWQETTRRFFLFLEVTTRRYLEGGAADLVLIAENVAVQTQLGSRWARVIPQYAELIGRTREQGLQHFLVPAPVAVEDRRRWREAGATGFYADGEPLDLAVLRDELGPHVLLAGGLSVQDLLLDYGDLERRVQAVIAPAAEGPLLVTLERPVSADVPVDHYRAYLNFVERPEWVEHLRRKRRARSDEQ